MVVVARAGEAALSSVEDLAGREVAARPSSSYHDTLEELQEDGVAVRIEPVPEDVETELVLQGVADGEYDLALADRHIVAIEQAHGRPLEVALEVKADQAHGVLVRDGDTALREALSAFVADAKASGLYDRLHRRYFEDQRRITETTTVRSDVDGQLSPYDELVQRHAEEHGFDWRLIVAQMHQESRFDAQAVSWAGARGVMQLMPRTARELGVTDPMDPAQAIEGGVTYLGRMRDRFDEALLPTDRTWLALASYNAGHGHVVDAQRLAARKGWDDGRWFGNVERAMLLLMQPKYARKSRYGYVRGTEPVHYVQTIRDRYQAYRTASAE